MSRALFCIYVTLEKKSEFIDTARSIKKIVFFTLAKAIGPSPAAPVGFFLPGPGQAGDRSVMPSGSWHLLFGRDSLPATLELYATPTPQILLLAAAETSPAHRVPWLWRKIEGS